MYNTHKILKKNEGNNRGTKNVKTYRFYCYFYYTSHLHIVRFYGTVILSLFRKFELATYRPKMKENNTTLLYSIVIAQRSVYITYTTYTHIPLYLRVL